MRIGHTARWNKDRGVLRLCCGIIALVAAPIACRAAAPAELQALVQACASNAAQCDPALVPHDAPVQLPGGVQSTIRYEWLREGLRGMKTAKPQDRGKRAALLLQHIADTTPQASLVAFSQARKDADAVLSNVEFSKSKPGWLDRQWQRLQDWLDQAFTVRTAGTRDWIRFLLEALLFAAPLLLLVLWLIRRIREERLHPHAPLERDSAPARRRTPWERMAQEHAARGEWRDAVHAIYWHTIGALEDQRVLAVSHSRTPREYLHLLQPGSPRRSGLRELTRLLESVWYGDAEPVERDFKHASTLAAQVVRP